MGQYPERSDMRAQKIAVAPSQHYGQAAAAERAQQAMPLAQNAQPPGTPQAAAAPPGPVPGGRGEFDRPSERPGEPVTHGLPVGAGAGPEALGGMAPTPDPILAQVLAWYQADPSESLREIIEELQTGG